MTTTTNYGEVYHRNAFPNAYGDSNGVQLVDMMDAEPIVWRPDGVNGFQLVSTANTIGGYCYFLCNVDAGQAYVLTLLVNFMGKPETRNGMLISVRENAGETTLAVDSNLSSGRHELRFTPKSSVIRVEFRAPKPVDDDTARANFVDIQLERADTFDRAIAQGGGKFFSHLTAPLNV